IIALGDKDRWNTLPPAGDKQFAHYYTQPGLAAALPSLYPGVFPNLAALVQSGKARADLQAILLTGIPSGIIPGFQNNTGSVLCAELRLNTAIPPSSSPNILGLLGGDLAGFPNGRRVFDDIVTVELRAVAGLTFALVDPSFTPDTAAGQGTDGLTDARVKAPLPNTFAPPPAPPPPAGAPPPAFPPPPAPPPPGGGAGPGARRPGAGARRTGGPDRHGGHAMSHPVLAKGSGTPQPPGRTPHKAPQAPLRCPGGETLLPRGHPRTPLPPQATETPPREGMNPHY